ncbi:MAG: Ultraviolet N-glycosylase/AP lyase [Candidatus Thorarchaeota archaeon]|nr:MAG: Ultraviolet N-glycosylase/AP lyase [Candidatus Thorarchaeota archaeon]
MELSSKTISEIAKKASMICDLLIANYGETVSSRKRPPLDELIYTILSQNTTDENAEIAYQNLLVEYPTWEQVLNAPDKKLQELIFPSGFYKVKTRRIKRTLKEIKRRVGALDLSILQDMEVEEAKEWLTSLHGVGQKTAAIVLLFCFRKPVVPVDTHVHRVTKRLGIVPQDYSHDSAQIFLEKILPRYCVYSLNHNLVKHGREICKAREPQCDQCFLSHLCDYYLSQ